MRRFIYTILYIVSGVVSLYAQSPKHEVRAAWITTAYGLDWPHTKASSATGIRRQQEELLEILDRLKEAHFNTVLFQTRTRGDVLYPSEIEPYNEILTGRLNGTPGYDPLAFAVEECHKRGMECHAWIVSIPLGNRKHVTRLGSSSVVKRKGAICVPYKREYFLNPGHPQTKEYLMGLVREVVTHYDVDGVHFDYLRYPEHAPRFPDGPEYRKYGKGRSLDQWRRDNITEIVRYLYKGVKALKPWVKVSSSPVGKYRDTSRYPSRGWNAYHTVHQDVQGWLGEGIQDQIYPMMYFRGNSFYPFALDWKEQSNGRHVIPGLGIYFLHPKEGDWKMEEIERQINFLRANHLDGEGFYRMQYLTENTQGIYDLLQQTYYTAPALTPAMPWMDATPPTQPQGLKIKKLAEGYWQLQWEASTDNDRQNPPTYVIYGSADGPVDLHNPAHIVAQRVEGTTFIYAPILPWKTCTHFAVTATDRYGNESREAAYGEANE
ncbi:MAG: family 10 glycosylhydrolase [Mediterranea sp.]|nr:family 10 glycosylhydrolase [Mediterranea sp.]